jgi:hypothetical protein
MAQRRRRRLAALHGCRHGVEVAGTDLCREHRGEALLGGRELYFLQFDEWSCCCSHSRARD